MASLVGLAPVDVPMSSCTQSMCTLGSDEDQPAVGTGGYSNERVPSGIAVEGGAARRGRLPCSTLPSENAWM